MATPGSVEPAIMEQRRKNRDAISQLFDRTSRNTASDEKKAAAKRELRRT